MVVPASVQDRDTLEALDPGKAAWPSLREAILDGAFTAASCHEWSTGTACAIVWSNVTQLRKALSCSRAAGSSNAASAGLCIGVDCCGIELVVWTSPARIAFAAVLSGVEDLLDPMPVQDAASQHKPTQTGS